MKGRTALLALIALLGCAPSRQGLERRPLSLPTESGWARVELDGPAQRQATGLWLGDGTGTPVPFLLERDGLWEPRRLELSQRILGTEDGAPAAEFTLKIPDGAQARDREQLRIDLDLAGEGTWVCEVEVERSLAEGRTVRLPADPPRHVFDLGPSGRSNLIRIPWDGDHYRLVLRTLHGRPPRLAGLSVFAATEAGDLGRESLMEPAQWGPLASDRPPAARWYMKLPAPERIVGLDLVLAPPAAPMSLVAFRPSGGRGPASSIPARGLLWNLPALQSRSSRIALEPTLTDGIEWSLPEGARVEQVRVLVRREVLLFPAERGALYFLHTGGEAKPAPGSLASLPPSSRAIQARPVLSLGPPESDPEGIPSREASSRAAAERARPWLPWAAALVVLVLGLAAVRLLRSDSGA
ncbi:MAG: hypothetical protein HY823_02450 [Acidobacteria bacterium]|nr:hypothetical protein [Acidobacteriota bacterium]